MDRDRLGSWKPGERVGRLTGWLLLVLSTATILTNAYYLQFLEPTLSRKTLGLLIVAVTGLWFLLQGCGFCCAGSGFPEIAPRSPSYGAARGRRWSSRSSLQLLSRSDTPAPGVGFPRATSPTSTEPYDADGTMTAPLAPRITPHSDSKKREMASARRSHE